MARLDQPVLPDILEIGLRVVFVGTAAGHASARRHAYFAGPGNQFWPTLHTIGLTPRLLVPEECTLLPSLGIGLTDLVKCRSGADGVLTATDFDVGGFRSRIITFAPSVVAFNGKKAASVALSKATGAVQYGLQSQSIGKSTVFVLPSTSGAARGFWDLDQWKQLADFVKCNVEGRS